MIMLLFQSVSFFQGAALPLIVRSVLLWVVCSVGVWPGDDRVSGGGGLRREISVLSQYATI